MKAASVYFENSQHPQYFKEIYRIFKNSCKKNLPIQLNIVKSKNNLNKEIYWKNNNLRKIIGWNYYIQNSKEDCILLDCDIIVLKDITEVFNEDFDIGYTFRDCKCSNSLNTGVMFFRVNERTREFVKEWENVCLKMYYDFKFWYEWKNKYYGLTQPAFGYLLENYKKEINFKVFPCSIYNASIYEYNKNTKVIHIQDPVWKKLLNLEKTEWWEEDKIKEVREIMDVYK